VLGVCKEAQNLKVLVGETIIDEYAYCEAIGNGQEPGCHRYVDTERHGGGIVACANPPRTSAAVWTC
jgi:hypothetical protein